MKTQAILTGLALTLVPATAFARLPDEAVLAMRKAATFYRQQAALHGGYVYHYSLDLKRRWGEWEATADQIWVQPPGTPTVGMAFVKAWYATRDPFYLDAARDAAEALAYGQLASGGWTNCVDFDPKGKRSAQYRNGKGRGKNNSSLDDGQTQSALRFLIQADEALKFKNQTIHQAAMVGLEALLKAQFPNGGFPQVWTGPVKPRRVDAARYPDYDWRTEGRVKEYWTMYTLNDDVCGYVAETLIEAQRTYRDPKYKAALSEAGRLPDPRSDARAAARVGTAVQHENAADLGQAFRAARRLRRRDSGGHRDAYANLRRDRKPHIPEADPQSAGVAQEIPPEGWPAGPLLRTQNEPAALHVAARNGVLADL